MQPLQLRWSVCDCVYDCENGHGRRSRIHRVHDDVRDCGRDRRSRIRHAHGDDVHGYGRDRRNRIRHVRDGDVRGYDRGRRSKLRHVRGGVRDRGHSRRNRIHRVRDGDVRGCGRDRRNRIHRVRDDDVHDCGRDHKSSLRVCVHGCDHGRRNKCDRDHESGHVHMNKSSFLRSYLSPLFVHQMHDAHFKYFFNMIVVKAVKYMLADLS